MRWMPETTAGDWIRAGLDEPWRGTMHDVIPRGFAAYARVFHRPQVAWVEGRAYPTRDEYERLPREDWPAVETATTTWAEVARAFGTLWHPLAQWNALVGVGQDIESGWQQVIGPDGRQYSAPDAGRLDADLLAVLMSHLIEGAAPHGYAAAWEGWGGLLGFYGTTPARAVVTMTTDEDDDPEVAARHRAMLERSMSDPWNNVFRKPEWQSGILSDEISRGERFALPGRDHVLFRGSLAALARPDWASAVPWADEHEAWTASPSLVWPDDHAWIVATEVDFDSTLVGGPATMIEAICADPALEALPLPAGSALTWDADPLNS